MLKPIIIILVLIAVAVQVPSVNAESECKACKGAEGDWTKTAAAFLEGKPLEKHWTYTVHGEGGQARIRGPKLR